MSVTVGMQRRAIITALSFAGIALVAPSVRAQESAAAEVLYQEGKRLMAAYDVHGACIKFAESQQLEPATGTLIILATCHEKEGKTASAWAEFTEAAARAGQAGQREREAFAREHADALEKERRKVLIEIPQAPAGIQVKLDGQSLGIVALETPFPVDPGEHELVVSAPKKKEWTERVIFQPGPGTSRVEVPVLEDLDSDILALVAATAFSDGDPNTGSNRNSSAQSGRTAGSNWNSSAQSGRTAGFIVGGAGILALGTGIVFGVRANHDSAESSRTIGIIAGAVGAVAAGVGIYLILTAEDPKRSASSASAHVVPLLAPDTAGACVNLIF